MRIAICALSAVLLSGCSWLGGVNNVFGGQGAHGAHGQKAGQYGYSNAVKYGQHARGAQHNAQAQQYGQQFGGGFPQQPQFGAPQQVTGQYGTHAANAGQVYGHQRSKGQMRKPRLRGTFSLGFERSVSGNILGGSDGSSIDLSPYNFRQSNGFSGSPTDGLTIESDLQAIATSAREPSISFDDVHSTPMRIGGGAEFIVSPRTTVFANLGYTTAEGNEGGSVDIIGRVVGESLDDERALLSAELGTDIVSTGIIYKGYRDNSLSGITNLGRDVEDLPIAQIAFDFSDLERLDFEVGGRHYLNPILKGNTARAVTPFVGGSIGAARYNALTYKGERQNLNLHEAVAVDDTRNVYVPQRNTQAPIEVFEAQWVPTGQLNAGLEWQATPKTAIAFETGVKFEGARRYGDTTDVNGNTIDGRKGDNNISVPFTIRGSYNF